MGVVIPAVLLCVAIASLLPVWIVATRVRRRRRNDWLRMSDHWMARHVR